MYYTPDDTHLIENAVQFLRNDTARDTLQGPNDANKIAALRYYIGTCTAGRPAPARELGAYRAVLCKLVYEAKQAGRLSSLSTYIILQSLESIKDLPMFRRLCPKYLSTAQNMGFGSWRLSRHETLMQTLAHRELGSSRRVSIIYRPALMDIMSAYEKQTLEALAAKDASPPAKVRIDIDTDFGDMAYRRETSADGAGRCYLCDAPKARRVACAVCGYVPRSR